MVFSALSQRFMTQHIPKTYKTGVSVILSFINNKSQSHKFQDFTEPFKRRNTKQDYNSLRKCHLDRFSGCCTLLIKFKGEENRDMMIL